MPAGRPTKYSPDHIRLIEAVGMCADEGLTIPAMAHAIGVAPSCISRWLDEIPQFQEAVKRIRDDRDSRVERALYERACGYKTQDKEYPPDTVSCIFWLKNRRPERWRDTKEHINKIESSDGEIDLLETARRLAFLITQGAEQQEAQQLPIKH